MMRILLIIAGLIAGSAQAAETYQSALFGVQVTKPDAWEVLNGTSDGVTVLERDKVQLAQAIKLHLKSPLVELAKHREPFNDVSPSVEIGIGEFSDVKGFEGEGLLVKYFEALKGAFTEFAFEQVPLTTTIGGRKAGYARFRHVVDLAKIGKVNIVSEMWAIPRDDFYIMIAASTRGDEKQESAPRSNGSFRPFDL